MLPYYLYRKNTECKNTKLCPIVKKSRFTKPKNKKLVDY